MRAWSGFERDASRNRGDIRQRGQAELSFRRVFRISGSVRYLESRSVAFMDDRCVDSSNPQMFELPIGPVANEGS
ncbi:hypothetical protein B7486_04660 [cyanobacterium TDX16]|nr:hypothetical protein B7486_04660 [cyanobacterium TDX16]